MKYRADIDGLRAVAVLSVLGFHYSISHLLNGGYVGVDIFFVISGFLITRIIYDDINSGAYSVVDFYHRRVRRIFPALFAVLIVALVATFFLRFPSEMRDIGQSVAASIFFVSNIFFFRSSNYFDDKLTSNPALHTWSLSVEEQFYILFPLLIFMIKSLNVNRQKLILGVAFVLCFVASIYEVYSNATAAFYLVSFRAWELLAGSLLAIGGLPKVTQRWLVEGISLAGVGAIFGAIFFYDKQTHFPGLAAALPCFGATAIIYAGGCGMNLVSSCLAFAPVRFIGLISYSLYLWHWPLLVFSVDIHRPESTPEKLTLVLVAVAFATASWWLVERPARTRPYRFSPRGTLALGVGFMVATSAFALSLGSLGDSFRPVPQSAEDILKFLDYPAAISMRDGQCFLTSHYNSFAEFKQQECLASSTSKKNVLIVGDSLAAHLWSGYTATFPNLNFMQATASGCMPVLHARGDKRCTDMMHFVFDDYLPAHPIDVVIISARWRATDVAAAVSTAAAMRKFAGRVVLSGPIEEYAQALPRLLAKENASNTAPGAIAYPSLMPEPKVADRLFASQKLPDGVVYVSPYQTLCTPNCRTMADARTPLQFDYGHMTKEGSAVLAGLIGPAALGELK